MWYHRQVRLNLYIPRDTQPLAVSHHALNLGGDETVPEPEVDKPGPGDLGGLADGRQAGPQLLGEARGHVAGLALEGLRERHCRVAL